MGDPIRRALSEPLELGPGEDAAGWWSAHRARALADPFEAALIGGLAADRLGYAFASGYEAALAKLVPTRDPAIARALCVTEDGPPHPRSIRARVEGGRIDGVKSFVTLGALAEELLVLVREGEADAEGRVPTGVWSVPAKAEGVRLEPMPELGFVPEIPHARVVLEGVAIERAQRLPGDGWVDLVRPFRTVEDTFVHVAVLGYVLRLARQHGAHDVIPRVCASLVALRALAEPPWDDAARHVALAGVIVAGAELASGVASWLPEGEERARWTRDLPLLRVASKAREARLAKARATLGV